MDRVNILIMIGVTAFVALLFAVVFFYWRRQYGVRTPRPQRRDESNHVVVVRKQDIDSDPERPR